MKIPYFQPNSSAAIQVLTIITVVQKVLQSLIASNPRAVTDLEIC